MTVCSCNCITPGRLNCELSASVCSSMWVWSSKLVIHCWITIRIEIGEYHLAHVIRNGYSVLICSELRTIRSVLAKKSKWAQNTSSIAHAMISAILGNFRTLKACCWYREQPQSHHNIYVKRAKHSRYTRSPLWGRFGMIFRKSGCMMGPTSL